MSHLKGGDTPYIQVQNKNYLYKEDNCACTLAPARPWNTTIKEEYLIND